MESTKNYSYELADKVIKFAETYLHVPEGKDAGKPLVIYPFMREIIYGIFKQDTNTKERVVKKAYISMPRKNAKSALVGIILLAVMSVPGLAKQSASIFSGALTKEQAALLHRLMRLMVIGTPIESKFKITDHKKTIENLSSGMVYHAVSREAGSAHGRSAYIFVQDELAMFKSNGEFFETMTSSQGAYDDALTIVIGTIGASPSDYWNQLIDTATEHPSEDTFVYYKHAGENEDIFDIDVIKSANPGYGTVRSEKELLSYAEDAKKSPAKKLYFMNLYLNMQVSHDELFIPMPTWKDLLVKDIDISSLKGKKAVMALDLAVGNFDLVACVVIVKGQDGTPIMIPHFWISAESIDERQGRYKFDFRAAREAGYVKTIPGKTMDWSYLAKDIAEIYHDYDIVKIGTDPYRFSDVERELPKYGVWIAYNGPKHDNTNNLVKLPQYKEHFDNYIGSFENMIYDQELKVVNNSVMNMNMSGAVLEVDNKDGRKIVKRSQLSLIDGAVAGAMAAFLYAEYVTIDENPTETMIG